MNKTTLVTIIIQTIQKLDLIDKHTNAYTGVGSNDQRLIHTYIIILFKLLTTQQL